MTENLKAALDGWFGDLTFWLVVLWAVLGFFTPRSCEQACSTCPWDQDSERRRRYWTWRRRRAHLEVIVDALFVVTGFGRVVCDLVLGEATWTLPLWALWGALCFRWYLGDARELERVREKAREVGA